MNRTCSPCPKGIPSGSSPDVFAKASLRDYRDASGEAIPSGEGLVGRSVYSLLFEKVVKIIIIELRMKAFVLIPKFFGLSNNSDGGSI